MRGNLSHNQYKQILFIEYNPYFNRIDIIKRIIYLSKFLKTVKKINILFFDQSKRSYYLVDVIKGNYSALPTNYYEAIKRFVRECKSICIMDENGENVFREEKSCDCILSGLHNDIPSSAINYIEKYFTIYRVKLSNISYLATQVLLIIDFLNEAQNILYLLPKL